MAANRGGLAVLVLACAVAAGCGTGDDRAAAADVVERFHAALEERDGAAACAELTEPTQSELEKQERKPCEEAILGLELPAGGRAAAARIYMTSGSVDLAEGTTAFLDKTSSGWRIAAAGCNPTAPGQPYDCELRG